jgi:prolipoprotein diacylglyceryltransferase
MTLWALFYLLSFVLFVILSTVLVKAKKLDIKFRNLYTIVYLTGMVCGAHALYFAFCEHTLVSPWLQAYYAAWPDRETGWRANLWGLRAVTVGSGGMWGGPWFVLLTLLPTVLLLRLDLPGKHDLLDVFAVSLAFPLALAKVGCFVNGCCYGRQGMGIRFTWLAADHPCALQPCFPTQLLDLIIYLAIGILLLVLLTRSIQKGRLILWFVLLYAIGRFGSEFTRGDNVGGKLGGLSPVQIILIAASVPNLVFLIRGQLFDRLLTARRPKERALASDVRLGEVDDKRVKALDRQALAWIVVLLLVCLALPALAFALLVPALFLAAQRYWGTRARPNSVQWSRLFNAFAYASLVSLFVSSWLVANSIPFYALWILFLFLSTAILDRFGDSVIKDDAYVPSPMEAST